MTFPSSSAVLVCAYCVHRVLISKYSCVQSNYQKLITMLVDLGSDTITFFSSVVLIELRVFRYVAKLLNPVCSLHRQLPVQNTAAVKYAFLSVFVNV